MRKLVSIIIAFMLIAIGISADTGDHDTSVDEVLSEIYENLRLDDGDRIDPDRVSPELLEELGEAVMSEIHPDSDVHEWMDEMMGGEGSDSLAAAHRWMGYRYLDGGYGMGMMGGMRGGMMGRGMMGYADRWGMMGDPDRSYDRYPFKSPEEIAGERYANGEITRDEYLQIMEDLSANE